MWPKPIVAQIGDVAGRRISCRAPTLRARRWPTGCARRARSSTRSSLPHGARRRATPADRATCAPGRSTRSPSPVPPPCAFSWRAGRAGWTATAALPAGARQSSASARSPPPPPANVGLPWTPSPTTYTAAGVVAALCALGALLEREIDTMTPDALSAMTRDDVLSPVPTRRPRRLRRSAHPAQHGARNDAGRRRFHLPAVCRRGAGRRAADQLDARPGAALGRPAGRRRSMS